MTAREQTSLEKLVTSWLTDPPTQRKRLPHLHIQLWRAVTEDHITKSRIGILTSPTEDPKVRWAVMFLEKLGGERKAICPHIEANARCVLNLPISEEEPVRDGKLLAANDR
jgi:hypothetical protein